MKRLFRLSGKFPQQEVLTMVSVGSPLEAEHADGGDEKVSPPVDEIDEVATEAMRRPGREREVDGPFIVAPDSADPWRGDLWTRVSPEGLARVNAKLDQPQQEVPAEEAARFTTREGFYVPPRDRELLRRIGGSAAASILEQFQEPPAE